MNSENRKNKGRFTHIAVGAAILLAIIGGGALMSQRNREEEAHKQDPENILGSTIGQINSKYCGKSGNANNRFYIGDRNFACLDIEEHFVDSDFDNYKLAKYSLSSFGYSFYFDVDKSQLDQRPMVIDNPEQFVGQMATAICPKYSLADFRIYAAGEHMGIMTVPCKDINQYSMFQDVIITDVYYDADEESGDDPEMYYEENNAKGTRRLLFDGEFVNDRPKF